MSLLLLRVLSPVGFINRVGNDSKIHPLSHPLRATNTEEDGGKPYKLYW